MNSNDLKLNADSTENFTIVCDKHGTHEWEGHFCCSLCMQVYTYEQAEKIERDENGYCQCGEKLLPEDDNDDNFTGVAICSLCFVILAAQLKQIQDEEQKKNGGEGVTDRGGY